MPSNVAVVTGYSSGLGREFTRILLERGWKVVGVSRNSEPTDLHTHFAEALSVVHGSVDAQDTVNEVFEGLDQPPLLVINCAGTGAFGDIGSYSAAEIHEVVSSNLSGLILFSDRASTVMREDGGYIVNVMSTASKKLRIAESVYVASKWGAKAYTRTLRDAVKAQKLPLKVIEVYPCGMNTPFWKHAVRPVTDGTGFPDPVGIAEQVIDEVEAARSVYCQEFTFERS